MSWKPLWLRGELLGSRLAPDEELPEAPRWIEIDEALLRAGGTLRPGEVTLPNEWVGKLWRWRLAGLRPLVATATVGSDTDLSAAREAALEMDLLAGGTLDAIRLLPPLPLPAAAVASRPDPVSVVGGSPICRERVLGALLGLAVGDSLGAPIENMPAEKVERLYGPFRDFVGGRGWGPGSPTRETTFALLWFREFASGRTVHTAADRARLGRALARWVTGRPRDFGHLTRAILLSYRDHPPVPAARAVWERSNRTTEFNAALSRAAAVGAALPDGPDARWSSTLAASAMTHPAPVCLACAIAVADGVAAAVRGEDPYAAACASAWDDSTSEALADLGSDWSPGGEDWAGHGRSHPLKTLRAAFWAVRQPGSLEEVLLELVHRGGDADTHGAVAGALLGAIHGVDAIPARWLEGLRVRNLIEGMVRRFTVKPREP